MPNSDIMSFAGSLVSDLYPTVTGHDRRMAIEVIADEASACVRKSRDEAIGPDNMPEFIRLVSSSDMRAVMTFIERIGVDLTETQAQALAQYRREKMGTGGESLMPAPPIPIHTTIGRRATGSADGPRRAEPTASPAPQVAITSTIGRRKGTAPTAEESNT